MKLPERWEPTYGDEGLYVVQDDRMSCQFVDSCLRMLLQVIFIVFKVLLQVANCLFCVPGGGRIT